MTRWNALRDWARRRRSTHLVWRGVVLVVGVALLAAGTAMLVLPGPGVVVMVLGLLVLASEFHWAHQLLTRARGRWASVRARMSRRADATTPERGGAAGETRDYLDTKTSISSPTR